ncbi:regulatory protein RecX [Agarivorans sp. 1_MG-2023]|uniref:regulatory protein RecX n=1 Tax=Agarivorans sp. 1_MG-2023 TaxID=3062634 RepID=UPI0026E2FA98|nr:regulatory protein RecX [Agarivorans sp. 1_MG-2023]MDO6763165.1 regulatory protein RecX [Agarivorans sp. 1_MG-2023]
MTNRSALHTTIDLLSRRSYSQQQLLQKLRQKDFQEAEIADAINYAIENAWLNDHNYASSLTRARLARGYGRNYIKQYLQSKGINSDLANQVLADPEWDWYQSLTLCFERKFKQGLPSDRVLKQKCTAYLYRRGFDFELINTLFSELQQQ